MPTVATSVIVSCPPEEVFDFLADARNLALWSSGVHTVAADAVRPGDGAEYRYHFPGRHREHRLICAAFHPCRAVEFRGRRMWSPVGTQTPHYAFRLLPHSRGTFVQLTVTCTLGGGLLLLAPFMAMAWRRDLPVDARRLREALCGPDRAPAPAPPDPVPVTDGSGRIAHLGVITREHRNGGLRPARLEPR
jgi:uncharacterized protein YndB with AHSA1/START domain